MLYGNRWIYGYALRLITCWNGWGRERETKRGSKIRKEIQRRDIVSTRFGRRKAANDYILQKKDLHKWKNEKWQETNKQENCETGITRQLMGSLLNCPFQHNPLIDILVHISITGTEKLFWYFYFKLLEAKTTTISRVSFAPHVALLHV